LATRRDLITQLLNVELRSVEKIQNSFSDKHINGPEIPGKPSALVHANELLKTIRQQLEILNENNGHINHLSGAVHRCPPEILRSIFLLTVEEAEDEREAATTLSHVSLKWRETALDIPDMWTNVNLSTKRALQSAEDYLERTH